LARFRTVVVYVSNGGAQLDNPGFKPSSVEKVPFTRMQAPVLDFDAMLDAEGSEFQTRQEVYQQYRTELTLEYRPRCVGSNSIN
jgi:hypothetical protein